MLNFSSRQRGHSLTLHPARQTKLKLLLTLELFPSLWSCSVHPHLTSKNRLYGLLETLQATVLNAVIRVLAAGALRPLLEILNDANYKLSMLRNATWTLSTFAVEKTHNLTGIRSAPASLFSPNSFIRMTMKCLPTHAGRSPNPPLCVQLETSVTGDDMQTQTIISCGALNSLLALLASPKDGIRKEACWTISNITAGTTQQIQSVIDANLVPHLVAILARGDFKTKKEACWAISNATSGGLNKPEQIRYLVSQGCIKPLCDLLTCPDNKIIQVALDGIDNILKVGEMDEQEHHGVNQMAVFIEEAGGMEKIHELQMHENTEIYRKAYSIIDKYFNEENDESAAIAPEVDQSTGTFAFPSQVDVPQGGFHF
ncbi:hypothetical protein BASA83_001526 [Batrachochytrium salamandrivorans]|nr:hypothetical protein BASA83_001526 [Batrachochytrium salamandrivorans]